MKEPGEWRAGGQRLGLVGVMIGVLLLTTPVFSQELPVKSYPVPGAPESRHPPRFLDTPAHPPGIGTYPHDVGVRHDPAFIEPLSGRYRTRVAAGRFGMSGWTAPNVPAGPDAREVNGWMSTGFTFTWGDPH